MRCGGDVGRREGELIRVVFAMRQTHPHPSPGVSASLRRSVSAEPCSAKPCLRPLEGEGETMGFGRGIKAGSAAHMLLRRGLLLPLQGGGREGDGVKGCARMNLPPTPAISSPAPPPFPSAPRCSRTATRETRPAQDHGYVQRPELLHRHAATIHFNDQHPFQTDEIEHVLSERMLPTKFHAQLPTARPAPQGLFRFGHGLAQSPCVSTPCGAGLSVHGVFLPNYPLNMNCCSVKFRQPFT